MKAIVLTYDAHIEVVDLMLHTYRVLWPTHPFIFKIPFNEKYPSALKEKYGDKIDMVQTRKETKYTVQTLLADIPDEEWVWWCTDDRYLVSIDVQRMNGLIGFIRSLTNPLIGGIMVVHNPWNNRYLNRKCCLVTPDGTTLWRNNTYHGFYSHHFIKSRVLKRVFLKEEYPDSYRLSTNDTVCKTIGLWPNPVKRTLINEQIYVCKESIATFQETFFEGKLTQACRDEFTRQGLSLPALEVAATAKR